VGLTFPLPGPACGTWNLGIDHTRDRKLAFRLSKNNAHRLFLGICDRDG